MGFKVNTGAGLKLVVNAEMPTAPGSCVAMDGSGEKRRSRLTTAHYGSVACGARHG